MSLSFPILVTAHSEKFIHIWNLETIAEGNFNPVTVYKSPLNYATSSLCAFGDGKGFAIGSIEGRCGITNVIFNKETPVGYEHKKHLNDFSFKCHRIETQTEGDACTVNHMAYNKKYNTFATVGSDGTFAIWNHEAKSRYKTSKETPSPMTSVCFSEDASILVFASGEDWNKGIEFAKSRPNQI